MGIVFTPLENAGVLRVFPEGKGYGDHYTFACTMSIDQDGVATLHGITKAPTPSEWRMIKKELSQYGVNTVAYHRYKDGVIIIKRYKI